MVRPELVLLPLVMGASAMARPEMELRRRAGRAALAVVFFARHLSRANVARRIVKRRQALATRLARESDPSALAEKDIDAILSMALGKSAPPKGTKPTAKPGVREELGSPMKSLMSKTKYRRD